MLRRTSPTAKDEEAGGPVDLCVRQPSSFPAVLGRFNSFPSWPVVALASEIVCRKASSKLAPQKQGGLVQAPAGTHEGPATTISKTRGTLRRAFEKLIRGARGVGKGREGGNAMKGAWAMARECDPTTGSGYELRG